MQELQPLPLFEPAQVEMFPAAPSLRGYHLIIHEATGVTDRADLEEIEDCMRHIIFHSTLDWQTRGQLHKGAIEALQVVRALGNVA